MKLVYITEGINPVFYSQVVELLNNIEKKSYFDEITLLIGLKEIKNVQKIEYINKNINIEFFKTYPIYPLINKLNQVSLYQLFKKLNINEDYIIHARTEFLGALAYSSYLKFNTTHANLLVDIRGSLYEEIKYYGRMNTILKFIKLFRYKEIMQKNLKNVLYFNAVSNDLKNYINVNFKIDLSKISVIPTISGSNFIYNLQNRIDTRKSLNLKDEDILFIFSSGSTQSWQNNDVIVNHISKKGYKILMLTKKEYTDPNVISKFVPYEEVPNYLNASDIGIIIRDNDTVNNVASPIKFSEYISSGLPVIANDSVSIIKDTINETKYGEIIELSEITTSIVDKLLELDREKISQYGINTFGINNVTDKYFQVYNKMQEDSNK